MPKFLLSRRNSASLHISFFISAHCTLADARGSVFKNKKPRTGIQYTVPQYRTSVQPKFYTNNNVNNLWQSAPVPQQASTMQPQQNQNNQNNMRADCCTLL